MKAKRTKYHPNEVVVNQGLAYIKLYDYLGNYKATAVIDTVSLDKIKNLKWYRSANGYVVCTQTRGKTRLLHREILGVTSECVDHKNGDKLDNRLINIRPATRSQNATNKQCAGVSYKKDKKKWKAYVFLMGKQIHLGYYDSRNEAIKARLTGEKKYYKEFAYHND